MKIGDWLRQSTKTLNSAGIGTDRLDCLVLLEDAIKKDRTWLLAHSEYSVKGSTYHKLENQIKRRAKHEPLAYIREKCEFYGREFYVGKRVLVPRPESETMITLTKNLLKHNSSIYRVRPCNVVDIGTGSGALGITAKLENPYVDVVLTDIDSSCLQVARKNAEKHEVSIQFIKGDLIEPVKNLEIDVILCNLPYVPDSYTVNEAAKTEPKIAIYGGEDGLDLYRKLFQQIAINPQKPTWIFTESLPFQHEELAKIASKSGYKLTKTDDFIQLFGDS